MPIRPENKARYPANWPEISIERREAAGWRCEDCRVQNGAYGWRDGAGRFHRVSARRVVREGAAYFVALPPIGRRRVIRIVLTVAHLDHTPENCDAANLKALCQRCHNRLDAPMRAAGIKERRALAEADPDQLTLFPEETTE